MRLCVYRYILVDGTDSCNCWYDHGRTKLVACGDPRLSQNIDGRTAGCVDTSDACRDCCIFILTYHKVVDNCGRKFVTRPDICPNAGTHLCKSCGVTSLPRSLSCEIRAKECVAM